MRTMAGTREVGGKWEGDEKSFQVDVKGKTPGTLLRRN